MIWLSVPLGLLIGGFLLINEFPDYRADRGANKRTLVVRLGHTMASRIFAVTLAAALLLLILLPLVSTIPSAVWLGLAAVPSAWFAARRLSTNPADTGRLVPAQAASLLTFVVYALGAGIGLLIG